MPKTTHLISNAVRTRMAGKMMVGEREAATESLPKKRSARDAVSATERMPLKKRRGEVSLKNDGARSRWR